MKNRNFISSIFAVAVLLAVGLACSDHGTKLELNGGELYYTQNVTEAEAKKLGDYLVSEGFFDGKPKTVQLEKAGSTFQVRMVVQPDKQNDKQMHEVFKEFGQQVSEDVFNNSPLEIHVCDDALKTLHVIKS